MAFGGMVVDNIDTGSVDIDTPVFQNGSYNHGDTTAVATGTVIAFNDGTLEYIPYVPAATGVAPAFGTASDPVGVIKTPFTGAASGISIQFLTTGSRVNAGRLVTKAGGYDGSTSEEIGRLGANGIVSTPVEQLTKLDNQ